MGRAPCCDKANVKKGPWSPEEDAKLKDYIERCGTGSNWIALPQKIGLKRCGKSCRLRWLNYLRPNIKHGGFSEEEEHIICSLYINIGSRWSIIAAQLPGRTDNDIKNYWNTRLKKKLLGKQRKEQAARNRVNSLKQKEMNMNNTSVNNNFTMVASADNKILMNNNTYSPMMPALPVSYQPILDLGGGVMMNNNDDSIKKLLIKLGGRFSNDGYDHQCSTLDIPSSSQQFYENSSMNLLVSSSTTTTTTTTHLAADASMMINPSSLNTNIHDHQFLLQNNNHYDIDGVANLHMLQGVLNSNDHFPIEMVPPYNDNPAEQKLEGLDDECFYGVDMVMINNGSNSTGTSTRTNSAESCSNTWLDDMGSLVYPSLVPNDYDPQQQDAGGLPQECDFEDSSYLGSL